MTMDSWMGVFHSSSRKKCHLILILTSMLKQLFFLERVTPISDFFNNAIVQQSTSQKHLGIHLDEKLDFNAHIKEKINKANKGIGLFRKLQNKLPMNALLTIHKYFLRLCLDYGDIVYDQSIVYNHPTNDSLGKKL